MPQEIEIPLEIEEQKPPEEPLEVKKTPEIYECDGDYMVFDHTDSIVIPTITASACKISPP